MVIGPTREWDHGEPFTEGQAVVWCPRPPPSAAPDEHGSGSRIRSGPAQYIDTSGKYITDRWYIGCENFSEGIGCARDSTGSTCFDRSGRVVFRHEGWVRPFSEGLAAVDVYDRARDTRQRWYLDRKGHTAIPPRPGLSDAPFREGLALVRVVSDTPVKHQGYGYINRHGRLVISTTYDVANQDASCFSEGLAPLRPDTVFGYIDHTGRLAIGPKWQLASPFSEGLAAVCIDSAGGRRWGYIDQAGRWVIQPGFYMAFEFKGGLARVVLDGNKWCYVNKQGKLLGVPDSL
jgi:hypothetical protein